MTLRISLAATAAAVLLAGTAEAATKNVVLVHGAFADGSGWKPVADILVKKGYTVSVVQPPETSLEDDVAATTRVLDAQNGPTVLVGHSYGGMIISEAGNHANVSSLVYVAAFMPEAGESLSKLQASNPAPARSVVPTKDGAFLFLDRASFHANFAADLPKAQADFMALSQVPLSVKSANGENKTPAWKTKPSFAIVATNDRAINPDLERSMYKRANATTIELKAAHTVYISQAAAVVKLIEQAASK